MASRYRILNNVVNVRSSPFKENNDNIITTLNQNEIVTLIDNANILWFKVTFTKNKKQILGYVFASLLELVSEENIPLTESSFITPPEVHFQSNATSNRNSVDSRHCPLGEPNMPIRSGESSELKVKEIYLILDFLSVDKSKRYLPVNQGKTTYCNIYAYDICFLSKVYLPRVWWTDKALISIQQNNQVGIVYGKTVLELRANDLFDWLNEWGDDYGWQRTFDLTELQDKANQGSISIICAKRLDTNRSGHIVVVVPETDSFSARKSSNVIIEPLQTQAGVSNKKLFNNSNQWWTKPNTFREVGFWYHS